MPKRILYYPNIDVPDSVWTKNVLLYWDEMSSIVPHQGFFLPRNISMLQEYGCYKPVFPREIFEQSGDEFFEVLEQRLRLLPEQGPGMMRMHVSKSYFMNERIILREHPEVTKVLGKLTQDSQYRETREDVATVYLKTLADFAVKNEENTVVGTDRTPLGGGLGENYGKPMEANSVLEFVFNRCIPMPAEDVSLEEILKFKADNKNQLVDFQSALDDLQKNICACKSADEEYDTLHAFRSSIKESLALAEETFKERSIKYVKGSLKTGISSLFSPDFLLDVAQEMPGLMAQTGNPDTLMLKLVLETGMELAKTALQECYRNRRIRKSKFSYLMHAREEGLYQDPREGFDSRGVLLF